MVNSTLLNSPVKAGVFLKRLLAVFLLSSSFLSVYAHPLQGGEEKVTIKEKDVPLRAVFKLIRKQTGYNFFYTQAYVNDERKVSLDVKGASVDNVLQRLLGGEYEWVYNEEAVSIRKKKLEEERSNLIDTTKNNSKERISVSGKITDASGNPVPGATILIKGTKEGVNANEMGEFSLPDVGMNTALVISSIGYEKREVVVRGKTVMARLNVNVNDLDVAVVQGYGTTSRRLTTSNIGRVTAEEIERQPVMNPLLALQGKVAGLNVTQTNGFASAPIKVELRGRNVIGVSPNETFPSDPLYIIDGVPLTILEIGGASSYATGSTGFLQSFGFKGPAGGQSPFFNINPQDIESIEVLKDADATAIYGSRGANGVILITTKKGKAGKTSFDLRIQQSISKVTRFWNMMNTQQYLQMRREALANDGITPSIAHGDVDLLLWDTTRNTDWQREILGGTGKNTDIQAGLSGGNTQTTFRIGAGYNRMTNIMTVSGADQRASFSFNLANHSKDNRFSISLTGTYSFTKSDMTNGPTDALVLPPNAPAIYDAAGNLNYEGFGGLNAEARALYPFFSLKQPYISKTNFLNSNLVISYQLIKGLSLSTSFGYNSAQANQQNLILIASQDPLSNPKGSADWAFNNNKNWIIEPMANYELSVGSGKLNFLIGSSIQENTTDGLMVTGSGYTSDDLIGTITNAPSQLSGESFGIYRYASLFSRINYNFRNKYIVNLNGRRDGSSRFGEKRQYGNFGSVGGAWIFTEENWIKNNIRFLSFGKLRGSYGITGTDAVGDYKYLTRWSSNNTMPYGGVGVLMPTQHANPGFQWQINRKFEGAVDLVFFGDDISISLAYYRNVCGNQLMQFPTPLMTGFNSVTANSPGRVQNDGWELVMSAKIVNTPKFKGSVSFNGSINHNKLLDYPNLERSPFASSLIVGQSLNIVQRLHYTGVNPKTGEYTVEDKNHDGKFLYEPGKENSDTYVYDLSPQFIGGLGINLSYKSLQLNLFFNIKKQIGRNALIPQGRDPGGVANQPVELLDKVWKKSGDVASYAKFTTMPLDSYLNFNFSDALYTDASFIRLSNLSLSYSLPSTYTKKIGMQGCNIFLHTNNLFVITRYKGIDPENQTFGGLPPTKTIAAGISFNF